MIDKFLELLGVELGEKFNIYSAETSVLSDYNPFHFKIKEGDFHLVNRDGDVSDDYAMHIISGDFKIAKLPWKPKEGEQYYYVVDDVCTTTFSPRAVEDLYRFKLRNYFKTREEAEKHRDDFTKQFDEIRKEWGA